MLAREPLRPAMLIRLLILTGGATVVYTAEAPGLLIVTISGAFLASLVVTRGLGSMLQTVRGHWQHVVVLGLMVAVGSVVRGYVAQSWSGINGSDIVVQAVVGMANPSLGAEVPLLPWSHVKLVLADLEHQPAAMTSLVGLAPMWIEIALIVSLGFWLALAGLAAFRRDPQAMALTWGPILLLAVLAPLTSYSARWATLNLPGTFYPLALCGAARLLDGVSADERQRWPGRALFIGLTLLIVVSIGMHVPRLASVVYRFAGPALPATDSFSLVEIDALAATIGTETVRIEMTHPHRQIVLLVEFGRRGLDLQWSPASWSFILAYRGWPPPTAEKDATFVLRSIEDPVEPGMTTVFTTRQYRLVRPTEPPVLPLTPRAP